MQKELMQWNDNKTQFMVFLLIALYLLLFLPFWQPVILGFLFAAACAPMVNAIRRKFHARRSRIAYLTLALTLTIFIAFVALIALQIYSQLYELFQDKEVLGSFNDKIGSIRDQIVGWANSKEYLQSFRIQDKLDKSVSGLLNSIKNGVLLGASWFVSNAPSILINLFMFVTAFGAFLVIQPRIWSNVTQALRLGSAGKEHFQRFEKICGLALGSVLLTAFLQSCLVVVGALIAGYGNLVMIFALAFFLAMIPVIGAGAVPLALTALSFLQGEVSSGIIMLVTSVIVSVSDNILRAWLFSRAAKSNAAISIITLIGGVTLFGFPGLFIAPVVEQLVMTYAFSEEGEPEANQITAAENPTRPDQVVEHTPKPV
jgi:predicted PurR-regulated permease PerM